MKLITTFAISFLFTTSAFAAGGIKLYADLEFPDTTKQHSATMQGDVGLQGAKGDTGPQGLKGDTGVQGPQGLPGMSATSPAIQMSYMTKSTSSVIPNVTTTDLNQILSFYAYSGVGNIYGYTSNLGMQFTSGTTSGLVIFYFLQYLPNGTIDPAFSPLKIAGGRWTSTTINGTPAILVNTAAVRYGMPDIYFTALNGNLTAGELVSSPLTPMPQTTAFSTNLVSNKTIAVTFPSGTVTAYLASTGYATGTDPSGNPFSNLPWAITGDGMLTLNNITLKIVSGSANPWTATYTNSRYTVPTKELGPITMLIN